MLCDSDVNSDPFLSGLMSLERSVCCLRNSAALSITRLLNSVQVMRICERSHSERKENTWVIVSDGSDVNECEVPLQ